MDGVSSLFGNSKVKQQQQRIEALEEENNNLNNHIKGLNSKIKTMETEHKTAIYKLTEQINKIFNYFPHIKELLRWEGFLERVGLPKEMIKRLFNREEVGATGSFYSNEHSKRFHAEKASLKLEQSKDDPSSIRLTINGTNIKDWIRHKQRAFLYALAINPQ